MRQLVNLKALALIVLVFAQAVPVSACDQPKASATRAERAAARAVKRAAERAGMDAAREYLRAELQAAAELPPGVIVTPHALLFVDGPEVPLEWVEWADPSGARRVRHAMFTDSLVRVGPGMSLALANLSGDIAVQVWERNDVRIQAEHDRDDRIVTELKSGVLRLGVRTRQGEPAEVAWTLTVPAWLPLDLSGMESEIAVTGMRSSVRAQSVRGDVVVSACQGALEANSVEGEVHVTDVNGNVSAGSVNSVIRLVRVTGPIVVQTINGDIQMEMLASPSVDASTVNGRVYYASPFQSHGRYVFSSHSGKVYVGMPSDQRVNVKVSSFNGQVESSMPGPMSAPRVPGRAYRFTMGELPELPPTPEIPHTPRLPRAPRAPDVPQPPELELASFGGLIQLESQADALLAIERNRAVLDSSHATIMRLRRELSRVKRLRRLADVPPPPDAPPPAPTPHR